MEYYFDSREEASNAAAAFMSRNLQRRLNQSTDSLAPVVVTGGSSPKACYEALSSSKLPWDRVQVVLSDERWLPPSDKDSNENLIRHSLLIGEAAAATLYPYYQQGSDIYKRSTSFSAELATLAMPFASCLLGMGGDGHIASLFPDAINFDEVIDSDCPDLCVPIETEASPYPRISLSMSALLQSDSVVLLFFGDAKRAVYERAKDIPDAYPVSRLLSQTQVPVEAFWAP